MFEELGEASDAKCIDPQKPVFSFWKKPNRFKPVFSGFFRFFPVFSGFLPVFSNKICENSRKGRETYRSVSALK